MKDRNGIKPEEMPEAIRRLLGPKGCGTSGIGVLELAADRLSELAEKPFAFAALRDPGCGDDAVVATMAELKEVVFFHREPCGYTQDELRDIADWLTERCAAILSDRGVSPGKYQTTADALNRYFLEALEGLSRGNCRDALRCLNVYGSYGDEIFRAYPHLSFYQGLARYGTGDYQGAEEDYRRALQHEPTDELALFHLGNALFRQRRFGEAIEAYSQAMDRHANFREALVNCALAVRQLGDDETARELAREEAVARAVFGEGTLQESALSHTLAIPDELDIFDIPIFINAYNRLGSLRRLVEWLEGAGYRRIYILDNGSTYPPLLSYYQQLEEGETPVQVLRLRKNLGHRALWQSGILEILRVETPYVYTDPDIRPTEECPSDVVAHLLAVLRKYPLLKKAGLGLRTDDITYPGAESTRTAEARFYLHPLEDELWFGALDTTFALYRNLRHYNLYIAARTTGRYMARHLPWYYDYDNLPADERYYMDHVNESATLVRKMKAEYGNFGRTKDAPLVSVIMPVYNAGKYLAEAIESILGQTYTNWELLAVDDGAMDDSLAILQEFARRDQRIRIIRHPENRGLPAARNTGMRQAKGKYLALMDADDISRPERLAKQTAFMEQNPQVDVCGTFARSFGAGQDAVISKPVDDREIKLNMLIVCAFVSASVMIRSETLRKYDLYFDETWKIVEDYEFWCRAMDRLTYHNLPEPLYLYRIVESSLAHGNTDRLTLATHTIIARTLNELTTKPLSLPAFHKPNWGACTREELEATISDLKKVVPHLKQSCFFSPDEVQCVVDFAVEKIQDYLSRQEENN